jgi:hypothetical protein
VELDLDTLLADHHQLAASLKRLRVRKVAPLPKETSHLRVSADGAWMLVVQHYQAANGDPDVERIPDWIAFGVLDLRSGTWAIQRTVGSAVGREIYDTHASDVLVFDPPDHVVLRGRDAAGEEKVSRVSLRDGAREPHAAAAAPAPGVAAALQSTEAARARVQALLEPASLFRVHPDDGIDLEYGPRLVDMTRADAPDGRTALVGTYEGRLMLVDLVTGRSRGEMETDTIYAATFRPDGERGYFADSGHLWEVDTTGWPEVERLVVPGASEEREPLLAVALADDGSVLASATSRRLLCRLGGTWRAWTLPRPMAAVVAFGIDAQRKHVTCVGSDGGVTSASYADAASPLNEVRPPSGDQATVACLDAGEATAYLTGSKLAAGRCRIEVVPLPGSTRRPEHIEVALQAEPDEYAVVRALARLEGATLVLHGDERSHEDSGTLLEERATVVPGPAPGLDRVLFSVRCVDNGPDRLCMCTHVTDLLPGSRVGRLVVRTDGGEVVISTPEGAESVAGAHAVREYSDGPENYVLSIAVPEEPALTVHHRETGTAITYALPWGGDTPPTWTLVGPNGRSVLLADGQGNVLVVRIGR